MTAASTQLFRRTLCVIGIGALAALVVFASIPRSTQFMHVLHKTGHPLVFGAIALLALVFFRSDERSKTVQPWRTYAIALGVAIVLGALTEIAQLFTNRGSSVTDVLRDTVGATAALGLFSSLFRTWSISERVSMRRVTLGVGIAATIIALAPLAWCVAAYVNRDARFPVIAEINTPLDSYFVSATNDKLETVKVPDIWARAANEHAFAVTFKPHASAGVQITEPHPDWRGYRTLVFDVTNPGDSDLPVSLRVHDREHDWRSEDRFNRTVTLKPLARQLVSVSIADIVHAPQNRTMDLSHIANVAIFVWQPHTSGEFLLHGIRLE